MLAEKNWIYLKLFLLFESIQLMLQVQTGPSQKFIASWIISATIGHSFRGLSFKAMNSFHKYIKIL